MSAHASALATRRDLLLGGVFAATSALAFARQPRATQDTVSMPLDEAIPTRIGRFGQTAAEGFVLPAAGPLTQRTYLDLLTRLYTELGAPPVMLLIAQGRADDPGMSVHRPERCYRSAGFSIENSRSTALPPPFPSGAQAIRMTARREDRVEQVFYWTRVGQRFPATASEQRAITIRENLLGVLPPASLFRLSVIGNDSGAALNLLDRFHAMLLAALSDRARTTLLGQ